MAARDFYVDLLLALARLVLLVVMAVLVVVLILAEAVAVPFDTCGFDRNRLRVVRANMTLLPTSMLHAPSRLGASRRILGVPCNDNYATLLECRVIISMVVVLATSCRVSTVVPAEIVLIRLAIMRMWLV